VRRTPRVSGEEKVLAGRGGKWGVEALDSGPSGTGRDHLSSTFTRSAGSGSTTELAARNALSAPGKLPRAAIALMAPATDSHSSPRRPENGRTQN
jgi:hypothetical protein